MELQVAATIKAKARRKVKSGEFSSMSAYVEYLIRSDAA